MSDVNPIATALRMQQQCDEDGVMCIVSRQAADHAADLIESLEAELADLNDGRKVVLPKNTEHALSMLSVVNFYLKPAKQ